ncbi:MAG: site-specific integrase [Phycisphaerae bacterium]|nr:site-specific integrase [Phycisphaerae bacterium]
MPKLTKKLPSYRLHKVSGNAVVTLNGRDHYLGPHDSPESVDAYKRLIAEWTTAGPAAAAASATVSAGGADFRVCELLAAYLEYAERYYIKDGEPTGEAKNVKEATRQLQEFYGMTRVADFGPTALKTVRQKMIEKKLSRRVVNFRVNRIRRVFKWGVENELVPPGVLHALQAVAPLRAGRSDAREIGPVRPVTEETVNAILPHVTPQVRAMIELQQLTGMRPNEVTAMRPMDIDRNQATWVYRPARHKTEHHGIERVIYLGPRAQAIVTPFLSRPADAYLFSPKEAVKQTRDRLRRGNNPPKKRRPRPKRVAGNRYTRRSYYYAIKRACKKANVEVWGPNRLRHSTATYLRKRFGIEAARVVLGHRSSAVTEVYAELDRAKAADIMAEVG